MTFLNLWSSIAPTTVYVTLIFLFISSLQTSIIVVMFLFALTFPTNNKLSELIFSCFGLYLFLNQKSSIPNGITIDFFEVSFLDSFKKFSITLFLYGLEMKITLLACLIICLPINLKKWILLKSFQLHCFYKV